MMAPGAGTNITTSAIEKMFLEEASWPRLSVANTKAHTS
ncbi:hypothetical protein X771_31315 [Mesorhizobium sp. LSJC277A00]|nr:hypothetical protein X771_31315 [Mesorhizobium sp. LSJC277A00]